MDESQNKMKKMNSSRKLMQMLINQDSEFFNEGKPAQKEQPQKEEEKKWVTVPI